MIQLGGAQVECYFEEPYCLDPTARPGYWNGVLHGLEGDGPQCRIHYCFKRQQDGLLLAEHVGWWLVSYESGRASWYCTEHLPVKYLIAIADEPGPFCHRVCARCEDRYGVQRRETV